MAKDMLDAIRAAEEECRQREAQAKTDAAAGLSEAGAKAKQLVFDREQKRLGECDAEIEKARSESERALAEARENALKGCDELTATAEKNRPSVVKNAADALLG